MEKLKGSQRIRGKIFVEKNKKVISGLTAERQADLKSLSEKFGLFFGGYVKI